MCLLRRIWTLAITNALSGKFWCFTLFDVLHFRNIMHCIVLCKGQLSLLCSCVNTGLAAQPKPLSHTLSIWLVHEDPAPWSWIKSATRHNDRSLNKFTLQMERRQTWNESAELLHRFYPLFAHHNRLHVLQWFTSSCLFRPFSNPHPQQQRKQSEMFSLWVTLRESGHFFYSCQAELRLALGVCYQIWTVLWKTPGRIPTTFLHNKQANKQTLYLYPLWKYADLEGNKMGTVCLLTDYECHVWHCLKRWKMFIQTVRDS